MDDTESPKRVGIAQGSFKKGRDLFYTEISGLNAQIFGAPEDYHADMRWDDFSSPATRTDPEIYYREDLHIINTNTVTVSEAVVQSVDGEWMRLMLRKSRSEDGGIDGNTTIMPVNLLYGGWLERLDREREVLHISNGEELSRQDLMTLHAFLHGIPRKLMASGFNVSVKAIEKRLQRIRDKLHHPQCSCYSLHGCTNWHGLVQFVMDRDDWFDLAPTYKSYPGRQFQRQ